jgi:VWFA-related protein
VAKFETSAYRVRVFFLLLLPLGFIVLLGIGSQIPQPLQHDVTVINIEVPVRVFDGDRFVDNLTMNDFEVFENGVAQKVEAAYLIRKTTVLNNVTISNGPPIPVPIPKPDESIKKRRFVLIFEMDDYLAQMGKAIDMFFTDVLTEDDTVQIVAPDSTWVIPKRPLTKDSRTAMAEDLKSRLRKSLMWSSARLKSLLMDLRMLSQADDPFAGLESILDQFIQSKVMNVGQYRKFAGYLKPLDGQKNAIIFYQKESYVIPTMFKTAFERASTWRDQYIHEDEIKKIFSDAGTTVHFLFLTKTKSAIGDVEYRNPSDAATGEMSGDFYQAFRNLADATGGISEATANPIYGFKRALDASENFYLVYYKPANYKADGKYKDIEVKVKGGKYKVTHRAGYIDK